MGLDMYLSTESQYAGSVAEQNNISEILPNYEDGQIIGGLPLFIATGNGDIYTSVINDKLPSKSTTVAYWRNAYHIHNWLDDQFGKGLENNTKYSITPEIVFELLRVTKLAQLTEKIEILVSQRFKPHKDNVDEYFWKDIDWTIKQLENVVRMPDFQNTTFTYLAWW